MARIKQVRVAPSDLLFDVLEVSNNSLPAMSVKLYQEITRLAAQKYDRALQWITPKFMRESAAKFPVSFVSRKPFEAEVFIVNIEGKKVTFWITFDLQGLSASAVPAFIQYLHEHLPDDSKIRVEHNDFVGEVELLREPSQVEDLKTHRVTYYLGDYRVKEPEKRVARQKVASATR